MRARRMRRHAAHVLDAREGPPARRHSSVIVKRPTPMTLPLELVPPTIAMPEPETAMPLTYIPLSPGHGGSSIEPRSPALVDRSGLRVVRQGGLVVPIGIVPVAGEDDGAVGRGAH